MDLLQSPAARPELSMKPRAVAKRERKAAGRRLAEQRKAGGAIRPGVTPSIARTVLTERELGILREQTDELFDKGSIDIRFMGTRFLELHRQGWTPPFIEHFAEATEMSSADRTLWTDEQFDQVWDWWRRLHPESRDIVLQESCAMARPATVSKGSEGQAATSYQ